MPQVKFKRMWFAPNSRRYRAFSTHGLEYVPDELLKYLPADAEIIKSQADEAEEAGEAGEDDDATRAFKEALKAESGSVIVDADVAGAAQAAHSIKKATWRGKK